MAMATSSALAAHSEPSRATTICSTHAPRIATGWEFLANARRGGLPRIFSKRGLLRVQRGDRIQMRGLARGIEAEADPEAAEKISESAMVGIERLKAKCPIRAAKADAITPTTIPIPPPTSESTTASTRNCSRMSRAVAPTAMRKPISRVRSVTEPA